MNSRLKATIDRMVEDAIRRILPGVMNEVLVATIAHGMGSPVNEERPRAGRKAPKKRRKVVREQKPVVKRKASPRDLRELLSIDESAGADFYQDPRLVGSDMNDDVDEPEVRESPISQRIQSLPPELRGLAEDIQLDDDGGEMWEDNEHDSGVVSSAGPLEIRNINEAAKHANIDFSRMKAVIGATSLAKKRIDHEDMQARAMFEQGRLKRMREQLNGGKPVE